MPRRDPTRLNLCSLQSLTHLELVGCDLSTSAWLGLEAVQPTLVSLACHNTLEELWHLLSPAMRPAAADHGKILLPVHTSDAPLDSLSPLHGSVWRQCSPPWCPWPVTTPWRSCGTCCPPPCGLPRLTMVSVQNRYPLHTSDAPLHSLLPLHGSAWRRYNPPLCPWPVTTFLEGAVGPAVLLHAACRG